jgi:hypothetical protein
MSPRGISDGEHEFRVPPFTVDGVEATVWQHKRHNAVVNKSATAAGRR